MTERQIIFRVNAARSRGLSYGHLFRCLALAHFLQQLPGLRTIFYLKGETKALEVVKKHGFKGILLPQEMMEKPLLEETAPCLTIFDLLHLPSWHADLTGKKIILTDHISSTHQADLIINSNIVQQGPVCQDKGTYLLGPSYFLLGPEFLQTRPAPIKREVHKVLISMGGSDPMDITLKTAQALAGQKDIFFTFVLGPGFVSREELIRILHSSRIHFQIKDQPANLAKLMAQADIMIMAGGRTPYEASYLGRPGIIIPSSPQEEKTAQAFFRHNIFPYLGQGWKTPQNKLSQELTDRLQQLREDYHLRCRIHRQGRKLVDGQGGSRIIQAIRQLLTI